MLTPVRTCSIWYRNYLMKKFWSRVNCMVGPAPGFYGWAQFWIFGGNYGGKLFISPNFPPASHIGLWGVGRWVGGSVGGIFGAWSFHKLYILNLLIQQGWERGNSTNPTIFFNVTILLAGIIIICLGMQLGGTEWVVDGKTIPYNGGIIITVVAGSHWKGLLRTRGRRRLCGWIWGWKLDWELIQGNMGWHLRCVRWLR